MKGFILAAGLGQRLNPLTKSLPKPLLTVANIPLIEYSIRFLSYYGIKDIIINIHYFHKLIQGFLGDGSRYGVKITYSFEKEALGTGGGVKKMCHQLNETFVLINSDTIINTDLNELYRKHQEKKAIATMLLRKYPQNSDYGIIKIDKEKRIRCILGQGEYKDALSSYMFTGVHIIEPSLLQYIPFDIKTCIIRYAYLKALDNDEYLHAEIENKYWSDVGTPKNIFETNMDVLEKRIDLEYMDPLKNFTLQSKGLEIVRMGENVKLGQYCRMIPPLIIGDNVKIGLRSTIGPHCVIGSNVSIAKNTHLSNSVIMGYTKINTQDKIAYTLFNKENSIKIDI